MNPKRLAELQHQRELVREHLAWLEREIAREHGVTPQAIAPAVVSIDIQPAAPPAAMPQPDPTGSAAAARRGCFILFAAALAILALALVSVYFLRYRDRPIFFVPPTEKSS